MHKMLTKKEISTKVSEVPFWGHSIPLPYGIVTPGRVMDNLKTFKKLQLPDDLKDKRVLDIGAWDGFYSFECEKRGAKVLALDNFKRMEKPDEKQYASLKNSGFEVAREILNSNVDFVEMDVCDISPERIGEFDITLFLGVLYHLKDPLAVLEKISSVTKELIVIESACMRTLSTVPLLRYAAGDSFNQDPTNWFIPNAQCIEGMLRDVGFTRVEIIYKPPFWKSLIRSILHLSILSYDRCIIKAWKG